MDSFFKCFVALHLSAVEVAVTVLLHSAWFWLANSSLRFFRSRRIIRFLYFMSCLSRCDIASSVGDSSSNVQRCFPFSWQSNSCRSSTSNGGVVGLSLTMSAQTASVEPYNRGMSFIRGKLFNDTFIDR